MLNQGKPVAFPLLILLTLLLSLDPSFEQHETPNSSAEKRTLLQLRSSLGIKAREWPIKEDPCVRWAGISCSNGSVIGINISGFKRTRRSSEDPKFAVDALTSLSKLSSFNASRFLLPGSIPDWFGPNLTSLETLDLRFCSIRNAIPDTLGNLITLTNLYLSGNTLTSMIPSSFGQLVNLAVLDLSGNMLTGSIPDSFGSLQNLRSLDMSSNAFSGAIPPTIGTLFRLQYLNLSRNNFGSTMPEMSNLSNLIDLDLSSNSLSGSITEFIFGGMTNLTTLLIGNNLLSGSLDVTMFPSPNKLQVLEMQSNKFTGDFPNALWSLTQLLVLDISNNNFTGLLPDGSSVETVAIGKLNMSSNMYYGNLTSILRRFNSIDLSGNYFQGRVPSFVSVNDFLSNNCLQNVSNQRGSEDCSSFYIQKGLSFDNFGLARTSKHKRSRSSHQETIIFASIFGGIGVILILVVLILLTLCLRKRAPTGQRGVNGSANVGPVPTESVPPPPEVQPVSFSSLGDKFTFELLYNATDGFSDLNLIKHGHSGSIFKGTMENGPTIVVKRIDLLTAKKDGYLVELDLFKKVSDSRLVPFLGHCLDNENEKFLVYKYMPNNDLSSAFYRKKNTDNNLKSLDWITRLKIATGAAEGLCHLHDYSPAIVHRDIQATSILLDDKFEVRLGSLTDVCTQEADPQQSRISKFLRFPQSSESGSSGSGTATCSYDIYCFGKVLLELVTGKLGISSSSGAEMQSWLEQLTPYISRNDKELMTTIVDPSLVIDDDLMEEVWAMAIVAKSCLDPRPSRRPPMKYILKALENPLRVVREEHAGSARMKPSSRGSWSSALSSSWRYSGTDTTVVPPTNSGKGGGSAKRSTTSNSQGSGGHNNGGENSSSRRYYSKEIYPEPDEEGEVERQALD